MTPGADEDAVPKEIFGIPLEAALLTLPAEGGEWMLVRVTVCGEIESVRVLELAAVGVGRVS